MQFGCFTYPLLYGLKCNLVTSISIFCPLCYCDWGQLYWFGISLSQDGYQHCCGGGVAFLSLEFLWSLGCKACSCHEPHVEGPYLDWGPTWRRKVLRHDTAWVSDLQQSVSYINQYFHFFLNHCVLGFLSLVTKCVQTKYCVFFFF